MGVQSQSSVTFNFLANLGVPNFFQNNIVQSCKKMFMHLKFCTRSVLKFLCTERPYCNNFAYFSKTVFVIIAKNYLLVFQQIADSLTKWA